jgi:nucleotide-binding universal stress UspA family protein
LHGGGRRFDPGILHLLMAPGRRTSGRLFLIFGRILATTDGSEASLRGVDVAAKMAAQDSAEFVLLTAVSVPQQVVLAATMDQRAIERYVERMAQEALSPAIEILRRVGVGAEIKVVVGPASEVILSEVDSMRVDLVVMGRNARYELKDLVLGTVSYRVARHVRVPVLLVP